MKRAVKLRPWRVKPLANHLRRGVWVRILTTTKARVTPGTRGIINRVHKDPRYMTVYVPIGGIEAHVINRRHLRVDRRGKKL